MIRSSSASSGSTAPRARVRPAGFPRGDASPRAGSFFSTRFFFAAFLVFFAFFRAAETPGRTDAVADLFAGFTVQLSEMFLFVFCSSDARRSLVEPLFFGFLQTVFAFFISAGCAFSAVVQKGALLTLLKQLLDVADPADVVPPPPHPQFFAIADHFYLVLVDMVVAKDDELRALLRLLLTRHRSVK